MPDLLDNPAFVVYAITSLLLCANLFFLWALSGVRRGATKTALNEEDAAQFGSRLVDTDPPEVARILRAHANAQASIYPFLLLALVMVLAEGSGRATAIFCSIFTLARYLYSFAYLKRMQPLRTAFFAIGGLTTIAMMVYIVWLLVG